jgi:hypothetical protein
MASKKDIAQLRKELRKQGFTEKVLKSNHIAVFKKGENGEEQQFVTTLPSTPSEHRGMLNAMAYLKRAGFVPPKRKGQTKKNLRTS